MSRPSGPSCCGSGIAPEEGLNRAFEDYYGGIYGSRWAELRRALLEPAQPAAYGHNLSRAYFLDKASILAANSLRLDAGGEILDACAAPGGKSLVLASRLPEGARLLANEVSSERRRRLAAVLDGHLGAELRGRVTVSGFDAAALAGRRGERGRFSAVLLDSPCSSEAHVLRDRRALEKWSPARPRFLAGRQWALLSAAFLLLKSGGSLVYATCAINPAENDGVAGRLLEKYGAAVLPDPPDFSGGEDCAWGKILLPDRCGGIGPMYVARFRKK
ncbi:MAG: 16S rRNA methyltransferase [Spirochaetaceae bacterium]|nr:16S rRNA methyltransferase [Spirochaetaceae bacterium]